MSSAVSSSIPYAVMRLGIPVSSFRPESEAPASSVKSETNQLRLLAAGGGLKDVITSSLSISVQERVLTGYTNGAALVTKALTSKGGILV